jgi:hypothetical protein
VQDPPVRIGAGDPGGTRRSIVGRLVSSLAVLTAAGGLVAFGTFGTFEPGRGGITHSVIAPSR